MRQTSKQGRKTRAQRIGDRGENRVADVLKTFLPESNILTNIILPNDDATSQIDVIGVASQGVFVFEVKNFHASRISCLISEKYWEYVEPKGNKL